MIFERVSLCFRHGLGRDIRQEITHRAPGASNHKGSRPPASSLMESLGQTKGWNSHIEKLQGKVIQNPEDILQ